MSKKRFAKRHASVRYIRVSNAQDRLIREQQAVITSMGSAFVTYINKVERGNLTPDQLAKLSRKARNQHGKLYAKQAKLQKKHATLGNCGPAQPPPPEAPRENARPKRT